MLIQFCVSIIFSCKFIYNIVTLTFLFIFRDNETCRPTKFFIYILMMTHPKMCENKKKSVNQQEI